MKYNIGSILTAGALLAVPVASHAALLDDFNSYAVGNASNASPPWVTTEGGGTNFVADIMDGGSSGSGDHFISVWANGDYRDISRTLNGQFSGLMTLEFDVYIDSETGVNTAIGLCSSINPDGAAVDWYADYGPYVRITPDDGGDLNAQVALDTRDGGGFVDNIAYLSVGQWYTVRLEINTQSQDFDVFLDDTQVYTNAAFRRAIEECDTVLLMGGNDAAPVNAVQYNVGIDNINFTGLGVPFSIISTAPTGTGVTNQPTLKAVIVNGTDTINTNSIALYLNGSAVAYSISQSLPTTTVTYAVAPPLDQVTTYTGRVVVAGTLSGLTLTNTWTFTTEANGEYIPAGYTLYEDFESYPDSGNRFTNGVTTAGKWLYIDGTSIAPNGNNTGLCDIEDDGEDTFARYGWSNPARGFVSDIPDIAEGSSGSYFFRIKTQDSTPDCSFGLSDQPITTTTNWTWSAFEIQIALTGSINLGARTAGVVTNLIAGGVPVDTWVNVQVDIHNNIGATNDTYDIYASYGGDTPALMASGLKFRNGTTNSLTSFFTYHNTVQSDRTACFDDIYYSGAGGGPTVDPDIQLISVDGGTVTLQWNSENGVTYSILQKSSLTGSWTPAKTGIAGGSPTTSDSVSVSGGDQEFFQIKGE